MAGEGLPMQTATRVLGVAESEIREVHRASNATYGARRVHAELTLGRGISVGHHAVEMLMARAGVRGVTGRPRSRRPRPDLIATDLVDRDFAGSEPNPLWVTNITEHPTREGKVYLPRIVGGAVVLDVYSRPVVGWSIDASPTAALVTDAPGMATDSRTPPAGAVIHSDRGTRFGSWAFTDRAKASGLLPSMGSIAECFDNAVIESFWSRMQVELLDRRRWKTRIELANAIFEYPEIRHHHRRRHSALGWRSPLEFETKNKIVVA